MLARLLLIRIAGTTAGTTWNKIADELGLLTLGTFTSPDGTFRQTAELTQGQRGILASLSVPCPGKIIEAVPQRPPPPARPPPAPSDTPRHHTSTHRRSSDPGSAH